MGSVNEVYLSDAVSANKAFVGSDGSIRTTSGISLAGNGTLTVYQPTWSVILNPNPARRQVQIQNQSADFPVLLRLSDDEMGTDGAYRLDPGMTYSFPPGVAWQRTIYGKVKSDGISDTAPVIAIEFNEPPQDEEE